MYFSELVKRICNLSAARRQIGRKTAAFWSVKSQGMFLHEGGHPAFVVRCLDNIIPLVSISIISTLYLASVAAQTGLVLPCRKPRRRVFS